MLIEWKYYAFTKDTSSYWMICHSLIQIERIQYFRLCISDIFDVENIRYISLIYIMSALE